MATVTSTTRQGIAAVIVTAAPALITQLPFPEGMNKCPHRSTGRSRH